MYKNIMHTMMIAACATTLAGCASIVSGSNKSVNVTTGKEKGAMCTLTNSRGSWRAHNTPDCTQVLRSTSDLVIDCRKGNLRGRKTISSSLEGWFLGNLIFGGLIGAPIDLATGAAFDYPHTVDVPLK